MIPNANCVIVRKPKFTDYIKHYDVLLTQKVEPIVQVCEVVAVGEILDKEEAPFEVKVGDKVMFDTSSPDTINLILKDGKYFITPIKCILANVEEGDEA